LTARMMYHQNAKPHDLRSTYWHAETEGFITPVMMQG
jgi:hypothetical protein